MKNTLRWVFLNCVCRWLSLHGQSAFEFFPEFVEKRVNADEKVQVDATADKSEQYFETGEGKDVEKAKSCCDPQQDDHWLDSIMVSLKKKNIFLKFCEKQTEMFTFNVPLMQ